ncbi:MAG TPA: hypothetical protein VGM94_03725, partial [Galbitalea sp.]
MTNKTRYATLAGMVLCVFAVAITIGLFLGADAGSIPDWVAAIATVAAFGAAIVAARYAAGAFNLERDREGELLRAKRTAQASLVAAWPDRFIPNWQQQQSGPDIAYEGISGAVAMLRNASDVPVTNVHVDFTVVLNFADGTKAAELSYLGGEDLAVLPPGSEPREIKWFAPSPVMIPGVPTLG